MRVTSIPPATAPLHLQHNNMKATIINNTRPYKTSTFGELKIGQFFLWADSNNAPSFALSEKHYDRAMKMSESSWYSFSPSGDRRNNDSLASANDKVFLLEPQEIIFAPVFV